MMRSDKHDPGAGSAGAAGAAGDLGEGRRSHPETDASAAFGIDSLVELPPRNIGDPFADPARQAIDGAGDTRPRVRRDLHWWLGGGVVLLALPLLVWQALDRDTASRAARADSAVQRASAQVRPPETTVALERTIREQTQTAFPALPPLPASAVPAAPPLPRSERHSPEALPSARRATDERFSVTGGTVVPDMEAARQERLAAESERRTADALASPVLALGASGASGAGGTASGRRDGWLREPDSPSPGMLLPAAPGATGGDLLARAIEPLRDAVRAGSGSGVPAGSSDRAWIERLQAAPDPTGTRPREARPGPGTRAVLQGSVIPAVLLTEINSELPGSLTAQVTQDVWDSTDSQNLLIPKGSRLIGEYSADVRPGQQRVLAAFSRLILPGGASLDLLGMQAGDAQGRSGLNDQVDRHFWTMFGSSFLIAGLASLIQGRNDSQGTVVVVPGSTAAATGAGVSSAAGTVLVETARTILGRTRNLPPTLVIRQGHRFSLTVQRDFLVPETLAGTYHAFYR